ncbi:MAG: ATP-dependent DNA helicase DinG [Candidatus Azotimanducaceae bacterium]|jgi:ATP-dependent DNA helicase DinG
MLDKEVKLEIQTAYSALLKAKGYSARYCQKRMIADIANTLGDIDADDEGIRVSEQHICVIEAGTGTGKTVAYAMAALPIAKALKKKLVISTATVALQEQIVFVDLPDIAKHSGLDFSYALAKGRRRYLCLSKLDQVLASSLSDNHTLAFYDDEFFPAGELPSELHRDLYEAMLTSLGKGEWDGDRDNWKSEIDYAAWSPISTDHVQCTGRQCSHYENCYFYRARDQIHNVDCIVTNHDLVLADVMMGGGAVLPALEETIYVFDEGHHLPDKAINHFSNFLQIRSTQIWLESLPGMLQKLGDELGNIGNLPHSLGQFESSCVDLVQTLESAAIVFQALEADAEGNETDRRYRFKRGVVEAHHRDLSHNVLLASQRLLGLLQHLEVALEERVTDTEPSERDGIEPWLAQVAAAAARMQTGTALWQDFMIADAPDAPPKARWISFREGAELMLNASPVAVNDTLQELLWSRCYAAVITSATLAVGADFSRFIRRVGVADDNRFTALLSPFNYAEQATLQVPAMKVDPRKADEHTDEVASMLPGLLAGVVGGLVLFASWRQMYRVTDQLPGEFLERVMSQGTLGKAEIVSRHKQKIDQGESSIIFGLASFAEGIDLPGSYCDHVVVVKIPFAVPDDPVGATLSEWIESNGGNSFQEIMIPDAALRMVQACGRLLRTETDTGTISILDRRLVTQRYGPMLLDALPPFRRLIL